MTKQNDTLPLRDWEYTAVNGLEGGIVEAYDERGALQMALDTLRETEDNMNTLLNGEFTLDFDFSTVRVTPVVLTPNDVLDHTVKALGLALDAEGEYRAMVWIAYNMGKGVRGDELSRIENQAMDAMYQNYKDNGML